MSTKTVAAVAAVLIVAIVGGAIIWVVSDDEGDRAAALESTTRPTAGAHRLLMPDQNGAQPFAIDNYSIGATRAGTQLKTGAAQTKYEPLQFTKPLDALSVAFFQAASQGAPQGTVRLSLNGTDSSGKPAELVRYDLSSAWFKSGDESAPGDKPTSGAQGVQIGYDALQLQLGQGLGYASDTNAVGRLEIPNVATAPFKGSQPAYVLSFSWGWNAQMPNPTTGDPGTFNIKAVTIVRELDRHAEWFWQQLATGSVTPEITLVLERPDSSGKPVAYMTYRFKNVEVTSVQDSASGADAHQQIKLEFAQIELEAAGGGAGAGQVGYDLKSGERY